MSGSIDKLNGKAKQAVGNVTDNKKLETEGKLQEAKGAIADTADSAIKSINKKVDEFEESLNNRKTK